ncbi:MAG: glycosyltransferase family 9 protein [Planctomycetota bacterium]
MTRVLVIKTGALGDVLRTTAILPGLAQQGAPLELVWLTARGAEPLVEHHRHVARVVAVDPKDAASVEAAGAALLGQRWDWIISLDDEAPLCSLASTLAAASPGARLSGAYMDASGARAYTDDVAPWFDMGLLSRHGKAAADRLKIENERTHPALYAEMLGVPEGRPELPLTEAARAHAAAFALQHGLGDGTRVIGLNTGAGGRWTSKGLPVERVLELAAVLDDECPRAYGWRPVFLVLGGPAEGERNREIMAGLAARGLRAVDGGTENGLLEFGALMELLEVLVTSDSLALHLGVAREVPIVAFFAPTSAAEIELYGLGEKVVSTAADYCSYRPDADNSSITAARLAAAVLRTVARSARV